MRTLHLLIAFLVICPAAARCAGPDDIAIADQSLWPAPILNHADYNAASRAEILVFLSAYGALPPPPNSDSIRTWKSRFENGFLLAYRDAARDCRGTALGCGFAGTTFPELLAFAAAFPARLSKAYSPWLAMSQTFFGIYAREQLRLATLFPNPTSEILPVADSEVFGDRFRDGEFLLTFDDGPTPAGGNTDKTARLVQNAGLSTFFFSVGSVLQPRLAASSPGAIAALYNRQCLASHGWEHKSHQTWGNWKDSLHKTWDQIQLIFPGSAVPFRPPYGQRTAEVVAEQLKLAGAPV
ncbi:MAG: polysaccharide deacetylase family protein, partial [Bdellovibrionota bacterium]